LIDGACRRQRLPQRARRGRSSRSARSPRAINRFRRTHLGEPVPRDIIMRFTCSYNGVEIFSADLHPAVAANPLIAFSTVATESGTLEFRWTGDNGYAATHTAAITVD
jgi:sulfur-oxidizing protein SoxZ